MPFANSDLSSHVFVIIIFTTQSKHKKAANMIFCICFTEVNYRFCCPAPMRRWERMSLRLTTLLPTSSATPDEPGVMHGNLAAVRFEWRGVGSIAALLRRLRLLQGVRCAKLADHPWADESEMVVGVTVFEWQRRLRAVPISRLE
jgi:hypothetical protein